MRKTPSIIESGRHTPTESLFVIQDLVVSVDFIEHIQRLTNRRSDGGTLIDEFLVFTDVLV